MKKTKLILLLMPALASSSIFASMGSIKVIYGDDNRVEVNQSKNQMYIKLSKSTAAMVPSHKLIEHNADQILLGGRTLGDGGKCESEPFYHQPTTANCSGFLVSKNILVTAGHCVTNQYDCDNNSWVFDYKVSRSNDSEVIVEKESVYKCKSIISRDLSDSTQNDFAVIELEREVLDREPLKYRASGKPSVGDKLVVIGHPSGLPTKIADGATVRSVNSVFLVANLDTYGGNSGSAVFNATTGDIEGILVRGDTDYVWNSEKGCQVSNRIGANAGRGEDVTLISAVTGLPEQEETQEPEPEEPTQPEEPTEPEEPTQPEPEPLSWWERFLRWLNARNS